MKSGTRILRPYFTSEWRALLGSGTSTLVMSAADVAQPWPLALALDHLLRGHKGAFDLHARDVNYLGLLALGVVAISLLDAAASYFSDFWLARAGERITHKLRIAVYGQLQAQSLEFHQERQKGELVTSVTSDVNQLGDFFENNVGDFAQSTLLIVGMVVVTLLKDPLMGAMAFATIPLVGLLSVKYRRLLSKDSRAQRAQDGKIASLATEALAAMPVIKAFGSEHYEQERVWLRSHRRMAIGFRLGRRQATFDGFTDLFAAVGTALVLVIGVFRVAAGAITAGELIVFAAYARRVNSPLRSLARDVAKVGMVGPRAERIAQILSVDKRLPEPPDAYHGGPAIGRVELDSVSFAYDPSRPVLDHFSLAIPAGQRCAVMGQSGAGKSTVGALIARFYDPTEGAVRIDGRDIRECSLAWLRGQIGVLLQETTLFTGTVRDNIAYGLNATLDEVIAAAKAAIAHDFITRLPRGYETRLGPQGTGLSGGQRQRIGIARTLLRNPPILLLDEPTTALDRENETLLMEALSTLMAGRTTILISHAPDLIRMAERAILIDQGQIVVDGPPDEVLRAAGTLWQGTDRRLNQAPRTSVNGVGRATHQRPAGPVADGLTVPAGPDTDVGEAAPTLSGP